jgi:hypothetical protein
MQEFSAGTRVAGDSLAFRVKRPDGGGRTQRARREAAKLNARQLS